ncbi:hypothetical protein Tco_0592615 [Tanacetum coccineum]
MLCKIFSKCLTTRVTGWDQPELQIMQMMYCFVNNIHVDYAELLWKDFTILFIITSSEQVSNWKDDDIMKNIFNSGRYKDKVGMKIPDWMISEEMKHTEHYRMYAEVFGLDVPLTKSQPTESTQGTHRTLSAPRRSGYDPHDDCSSCRGENRVKLQKTSEYESMCVWRYRRVSSVQKTMEYNKANVQDIMEDKIVARRANECIVTITEPDYNNLNKNNIGDMYLLIMNGKVPDYAETGLLWSLSVFIRSSMILERVHDFQLGIESYQQKVNLTGPTISFP